MAVIEWNANAKEPITKRKKVIIYYKNENE